MGLSRPFTWTLRYKKNPSGGDAWLHRLQFFCADVRLHQASQKIRITEIILRDNLVIS